MYRVGSVLGLCSVVAPGPAPVPDLARELAAGRGVVAAGPRLLAGRLVAADVGLVVAAPRPAPRHRVHVQRPPPPHCIVYPHTCSVLA